MCALVQLLMLHHKNVFPWAVITPMVHAMAAHAWELFEITEGLPIAVFSEKAIEAWNKYVRAYISGPACRARQVSIKANTEDVFKRCFAISGPKTASMK